MADYGHLRTEKELAALEKRIAKIYSEASEDLQKKIDQYFARFEKRDKQQRELLEAGKITEEQYKQWRLAQIGRGKRFEALRDQVAERYTKANETAVAYVNDTTPSIYSLNRNYAAYTIEQVSGEVGFTLWDEQTVKRLIVEEPNLMPYYPAKKALKRGIDLAWGKQQITKQVTSGILQGESIGKLADRLQKNISGMNRASAIRTARTAVTGAQNAGRMDSYAAAQKMGIELEREWLATLDGRTRHAHAVLDGQTAPMGKPFEVDGHKIRFPGDPTAKAYLVYNCRCTLIAKVKGVDMSDALRRDRYGVLPNMTYAQWEASKRGAEAPKISTIRTKEVEDWRKTLQHQKNLAILKAKIDSGECSTKLSVQQQSKHIEGTKQFDQYRMARLSRGEMPQSVLTIELDSAQDLIDRYSCTGIVATTRSGKPRSVEFVSADGVVGKYFANDAYHETKRIAIHYGKKGAHIVPVEDKNNG